jgi:integrase/recombinase XerD
MVNTRILLDNYKKREDGVYPLRLRLTHNRVQKYYYLDYHLTEDEFAELSKPNPRKTIKDIKVQLSYIENRAKSILQELPVFSFDLFKSKFYNKPSITGAVSLIEFIEGLIKEKINANKISTASSYQSTLTALKSFSKKVNFSDINTDFIINFHSHMLSEKKSETTIGIYMRTFRAILNLAIEKKHFPKELYPFDNRQYSIPTGANPKKALTSSEIKSLLEYNPISIQESRALDFFMLSYLCNGINTKDILLLKKSDIQNNFIFFMREKTKYSATSKIIQVPLLDKAKKIIEKWQDNSNSKYLFPFIPNNATALDIYNIKHQFLKINNKYFKIICAKLNMVKVYSSYSARHSYSKAMLDSGQNISYISQSLGHESLATTSKYLNSFQDYNMLEIHKNALLPK